MPRWLTAVLLIAVLVLIPTVGDDTFASSKYEPVFGPRPRVATTPAELESIKASPDFEQRKQQAIRAAAPYLPDPEKGVEPMDVPTEWGNWIYYYRNPKTGGALTALSPTEHKDNKTGEVFTDKQIVDAYRTKMHDQVNEAAERLGWAYALTGDDRYADEVKRILTILADTYEYLPKRRDRWGREGWMAKIGGRRYCQSLTESYGAIKLAKAYDLTRNSKVWSDAQAKHVEDDFFRPTVHTLSWATWDHNHQSWYNAGLMAIAAALGDRDLAKRTLDMRRGFLHQLEHNIDSDGLWHEGTMSYHSYGLRALMELVEVARRNGMPVDGEPKFRLVFEGPLRIAYPNGQLPAINDSDRANINMFRGHWEWAFETWGDPLFAYAAAFGDEKKIKQLLGDDAKPQLILETRTLDLKANGLITLRRSEGESAVACFMDYGFHGAAHGHPDKLNIMIYANGREWVFDPGRLGQQYSEMVSYYKQTVAHNTVILDGKSQQPDDGKLLWLVDEDEYTAAAGESRRAYPGTVLRRYLLLTDRMLVDVFEVESDAKHRIDLPAHVIAPTLEPLSGAAIPDVAAQIGEGDGYQHLKDATVYKTDELSRWRWTDPQKRELHVWLPRTPGEEVLSMTSFGYRREEKTPTLLRRVQGDAARFVAVYDLSGDGSYVTGVKAVGPAAAGVTIETTGDPWVVGFTPDGPIINP